MPATNNASIKCELSAHHQMVESHQFLRDNIGFKMRNKIPGPPGTHGVIFYQFCQLLTGVLCRYGGGQQLSFVSSLCCVKTLD